MTAPRAEKAQTSAGDADLDAALTRFWEADRPSQQRRLAFLRKAARGRRPRASTLHEARQIAHGLAGVAVMYGFREAGMLAAQM